MSFTKFSTATIASSLVAAALFSISPARAQGYTAAGTQPPAPEQAQTQPPVCPPGYVLYQAPMQPGATELPPPTCYQPQPVQAAAPAYRTSYSAPTAPAYGGGGYAPRPQYYPYPHHHHHHGPKPVPLGPLVIITNPTPTPIPNPTPNPNPGTGEIKPGQVVCITAPCNVGGNKGGGTPNPAQIPGQVKPGQVFCIKAPCNVGGNKGMPGQNPNGKLTGQNPAGKFTGQNPNAKFAGQVPGARQYLLGPYKAPQVGPRPHVFHPGGLKPTGFKPGGFRPGSFQQRPAMMARAQAAPRSGMGGGGRRFAGRR